MLLLWTEAFKAGDTTYSLQLHPVPGSVGWAGLQFRPQQSDLLSVRGAVYQDPAGWGTEQEEEGEAALMTYILSRLEARARDSGMQTLMESSLAEL